MLTRLHEHLMIELPRFDLARRGASCGRRATGSKRRSCFRGRDWQANGRAPWIAKASCQRHATATLARRDVVCTAAHALRGPGVRRGRGRLSVRVSLRSVVSEREATARARAVRPAQRVGVCVRGVRVCPQQRGIDVVPRVGFTNQAQAGSTPRLVLHSTGEACARRAVRPPWSRDRTG